MNLFEFGIESAGDDHSTAFKTVHEIGPVEAINVVSDRENKIPAEMLDADSSSGQSCELTLRTREEAFRREL